MPSLPAKGARMEPASSMPALSISPSSLVAAYQTVAASCRVALLRHAGHGRGGTDRRPGDVGAPQC